MCRLLGSSPRIPQEVSGRCREEIPCASHRPRSRRKMLHVLNARLALDGPHPIRAYGAPLSAAGASGLSLQEGPPRERHVLGRSSPHRPRKPDDPTLEVRERDDLSRPHTHDMRSFATDAGAPVTRCFPKGGRFPPLFACCHLPTRLPRGDVAQMVSPADSLSADRTLLTTCTDKGKPIRDFQ